MGLTMNEKRSVAAQMAAGYQKARKKQKGGILRQFVELTGYVRQCASTIDRVLAPDRKKQALKGRSGTKPGTLLKHQIKIRTFSEWNEQKPGFVQIDLVGLDGSFRALF